MLTVFATEDAATPQGRRLVQTLVERAREEGLSGATVIRGVEGFGQSGRRRTTRFTDVAVDLPVLVQIVDSDERISEFLPLVKALTGDYLVLVQPVSIEHHPEQRPVLDDDA